MEAGLVTSSAACTCSTSTRKASRCRMAAYARRLAVLAGLYAVSGSSAVTAAELLSEDWQFSFTPYLWALALDGDVTVRGEEASPSVSFKEILEDLSYAIMGSVDARKGRIGVFADGLFSQLGDSADVGPAQIKVDANLSIIAGAAYFRAGPWNLDGTAGASGPKLVVDTYAGARYTYLSTELKFRQLGRQTSGDLDWVDPIIGLRTLWEITPSWNLNVFGDIGGFGVSGDADFSWQAAALVGYRFDLLGKDDANFVMGYRALQQKYRDGDGSSELEWDVTLHGPVMGLSISF